MAGGWFESVAEAQRRAKRTLPPSVYKAILAGTERGVTLQDNVAAFSDLGFAPHIAGLRPQRELGTTVMGVPVSLPVLISPVGVQAVHPEAELAVARAAAARGTAMGLSGFASTPVEEVVAANPATFSQVYWAGPREAIARRLERARAAGVAGLILTLDWTYSHARDWGSPTIPERLDAKTMARFAPEVLLRPRWAVRWARSGAPPTLEVPNMVAAGEEAPRFFAAYGEWMGTPPPSWDDVRWLREQWDGPFMLKGVIRVDDARRAVEDVGVTAISVSNHGGNNLDGTPATIRALAAVADAVGGDVELLLDGGIRRGSDVVKALALGARAVMIGRAYLWGLAANGQAGVENVLDILRTGIESALLGLGHGAIHDLSADDLVIPRTLPAGSALETLPSGAVTGDLLVVPLGATEQHGPHLPLGTDTIIARALADGLSDVTVAPALPYGSSGEHAGFAGTLSIGRDALEHVLVELARSAAFARVLFVCAHGGNAEPLAAAVRRLRAEGRDVRAWAPRWTAVETLAGRDAAAATHAAIAARGDAHAGRTETSLILALAPTLVSAAREAGNVAPVAELMPALRAKGVREVSPNGVLGDPAGASADEGRALLAAATADLVAFVEAWA